MTSTIATIANATSVEVIPPKVSLLICLPGVTTAASGTHPFLERSPTRSVSNVQMYTTSTRPANTAGSDVHPCWRFWYKFFVKQLFLYFTNVHVILLISDMCPGGWARRWLKWLRLLCSQLLLCSSVNPWYLDLICELDFFFPSQWVSCQEFHNLLFNYSPKKSYPISLLNRHRHSWTLQWTSLTSSWDPVSNIYDVICQKY